MISEGSLVKVIAAEGEHKASSALAAAADVIQESPHALQVSPALLRYSPTHYTLHTAAQVSANSQLNISWTQLNYNIPNAYQHFSTLLVTTHNVKKQWKVKKLCQETETSLKGIARNSDIWAKNCQETVTNCLENIKNEWKADKQTSRKTDKMTVTSWGSWW